MDILDLLRSRASDAPWYTKWWWWLLIAIAAILAVFVAAASSNMAKKERSRKIKIVEENTKVIVETEHAIEDAKEVLKEAAVTIRRIDELDVEIENVDERYDMMIDKVDKAETLEELRKLREEMIRNEL